MGRTSRRLAKKSAREARRRQEEARLAVVTDNVHTLDAKEKNGGVGMTIGCRRRANNLALQFIGLQATRLSTTFTVAGYIPVSSFDAFRSGHVKTAVRQGLYGAARLESRRVHSPQVRLLPPTQ